jgi:hypothetical protein
MTTDAEADVVTVRVTLGWQMRQAQWVSFCGQVVAQRVVWDEPVVLGEGCEVVGGWGPRSAGSADHPQLGYGGPVVVEVAAVSRAVLADAEPGWTYEVDDGEGPREALIRDVLAAERDRLLVRVADIDAILGEDGAYPDKGGLEDDNGDD